MAYLAGFFPTGNQPDHEIIWVINLNYFLLQKDKSREGRVLKRHGEQLLQKDKRRVGRVLKGMENNFFECNEASFYESFLSWLLHCVIKSIKNSKLSAVVKFANLLI